jgi:hypothetical protein
MAVLSKLSAFWNRSAPVDSLLAFARERHRLTQDAEALLGPAGWTLLRTYGRLMSGKFSGQYISGLPDAEVRALLKALERGEKIPVHLMHRHRSGCYESSWLSLTKGHLMMHFPDRTECADG